MDLIPIPKEEIAQTVKTTKYRVISQIRGKMKNKKDNHETGILKKTCVKMSQYCIDENSLDKDSVDSLITNMHRSILILQKKKLQKRKKRK